MAHYAIFRQRDNAAAFTAAGPAIPGAEKETADQKAQREALAENPGNWDLVAVVADRPVKDEQAIVAEVAREPGLFKVLRFDQGTNYRNAMSATKV